MSGSHTVRFTSEVMTHVCHFYKPNYIFILLRYPEDRVPSFLSNKASMMDDLEKQGWPVSPDDINLLEKEIQQAETFLLQSKDLRQKSEEVEKNTPAVRG